jgi:hypothetical protein
MSDRVAWEVIEGDPVGVAIVQLGTFDGTMTALLATLNLQLGHENAPRGWPRTPRGLRGRLNRLSPAFAKIGTNIKITRTNQGSHVEIRPTNNSHDNHNVQPSDGHDCSNRHTDELSAGFDTTDYEERFPDLF